jgi:hypothetical protein
VSIDRGFDHAKKVMPEVWSRLAKAQLDGLRINVPIDTQYLLLLLILNSLCFFADPYIKAEDPANFSEVIEILNHAEKYDDLSHQAQPQRFHAKRAPLLQQQLPSIFQHSRTCCTQDNARIRTVQSGGRCPNYESEVTRRHLKLNQGLNHPQQRQWS